MREKIEGAVANFFTPASKKPKDRTTWSERAPEAGSTPTLLVGRYEAEGQTEEDRAAKRRKIAAFDLVSPPGNGAAEIGGGSC